MVIVHSYVGHYHRVSCLELRCGFSLMIGRSKSRSRCFLNLAAVFLSDLFQEASNTSASQHVEDYPPVIKHGNGKSPIIINGGVNGKTIHKWWIFYDFLLPCLITRG